MKLTQEQIEQIEQIVERGHTAEIKTERAGAVTVIVAVATTREIVSRTPNQ